MLGSASESTPRCGTYSGTFSDAAGLAGFAAAGLAAGRTEPVLIGPGLAFGFIAPRTEPVTDAGALAALPNTPSTRSFVEVPDAVSSTFLPIRYMSAVNGSGLPVISRFQ